MEQSLANQRNTKLRKERYVSVYTTLYATNMRQPICAFSSRKQSQPDACICKTNTKSPIHLYTYQGTSKKKENAEENPYIQISNYT